MTKRVIDLHIVQDAANLFNVADALGLEYVSCMDCVREHYARLHELFFGKSEKVPHRPFYVDVDNNVGVAAALDHIRNTVKTCYLYADKDGFIEKQCLVNMLRNDRGIPQRLKEKDAFVFDKMVDVFTTRVIEEFQGCYGDSLYEDRILQYERNWPEFGNYWWDEDGYQFVKDVEEEDEQ